MQLHWRLRRTFPSPRWAPSANCAPASLSSAQVPPGQSGMEAGDATLAALAACASGDSISLQALPLDSVPLGQLAPPAKVGSPRVGFKPPQPAKTAFPSQFGSLAHAAAANGHAHIVAALAGMGATVSAVDAVRFLGPRGDLAAHTPPRLHTQDGRTALLLACTKGHLDVVEALLQAGAPANAVDKVRSSARRAAQTPHAAPAAAERVQRPALRGAA